MRHIPGCNFSVNRFHKRENSFVTEISNYKVGAPWKALKLGKFKQGVSKQGVTTFAWRPGSQYDVAATRDANNVLASDCRAQFGRPSIYKERMSHLCDSTVAGLTARRDKLLASKCEYPPFRHLPLIKCARSKAFIPCSFLLIGLCTFFGAC